MENHIKSFVFLFFNTFDMSFHVCFFKYEIITICRLEQISSDYFVLYQK
jgi:hypothetical protein